MTQRGWEELRPYLRDERPPNDAVVVVRGGPDTVAKLAMHARRTHDAYVLDGEPLWGISAYCALDDVGPASLDGLLRRFASYRAVHLPRMGQLLRAGFPLLPSFGRPHYTIRLDGDDSAGLTGCSTPSALRRPISIIEENGREGGNHGPRRHHLRPHG